MLAVAVKGKKRKKRTRIDCKECGPAGKMINKIKVLFERLHVLVSRLLASYKVSWQRGEVSICVSEVL